MKELLSRAKVLIISVAVVCVTVVCFNFSNWFGGHLSKGEAQRAVDIGFNQMGEIVQWDKVMAILGGKSGAEVIGVQELQGANEAIADIQFHSVTFKPAMPFATTQTLDKGTAHFKRYNDGRWILTAINPGSPLYLGLIQMEVAVNK